MKRHLLFPLLGLLTFTPVRSMADEGINRRIEELDRKIAALKSEKAGILAKNSPSVPAFGTGIFDAQGEVDPHVSNAILFIEGDQQSGTGFMARTEGKKYLYTSAGVLSGNTRLTVRNPAGTIFKKFGDLEAAENGDAVRMEITEEVPDFLEIHSTGRPVQINRKIAVLGAEGAMGSVTVEEGSVLGTSAETFEVDAANGKFNNGGPVVDLATRQVVGLATRMSGGMEDVWSEGTRQGQVRRFACRLDREWKWKPMKIGTFLADGKALEEYALETRICMAVGGEMKDGVTNGSVSSGGIIPWDTYRPPIKPDHPLRLAYNALKADLGERRRTPTTTETQKKLQSLLSVTVSRASRSKDVLKPEGYSWYHRVRAEEEIKRREKCIKMLN